jgi:glycerol-3-phosphate responsive antiterminator
LPLSLLLYLFLDLGFGGLFLIKRKGANMSEKEMQRMIEEQINAVLMLEKQMEDIRKQMQILQALINEMKP